jgi:RNA polymerase sigma factor (sigma-70 family)
MDEINKSSTPESPIKEISKYVEEHVDLLYHFARYSANSRDLAEDLVHKTFISTLKDWQRFRRESSPTTWLVSILRHKIIDHYRRKKPASLEDFQDGGGAVTQ